MFFPRFLETVDCSALLLLVRIVCSQCLDAGCCYTDVYRHTAAEKCRQFNTAVALVFSARCNIYISRLCYDVSVRLSVRLSMTEVHWHIIANLARSANLPEGLSILLALISSFFTMSKAISVSTAPVSYTHLTLPTIYSV